MLLTRLASLVYLACVTAITLNSHAELKDRSVVSLEERDTPSKTEDAGPITNAERLANGMIPALPKALKGFMAEKPRKQSAKMYNKRGPACPSASPIVFQPHPPAPTNQVPNFPFQEPYIGVQVPFQAKIFTESSNTVWVSDAGLVSFRATADEQNTPLPTIRAPFDTVFFYWDWILFDENKAGHGIFWANDTNSITARWVGYVAGPATPPGGYPSYNFDATVYYNKNTPGIWYIYYDVVGTGSLGHGATIGAQSGETFIQYAYNQPGSVTQGMRLAIDTNCQGGFTVG